MLNLYHYFNKPILDNHDLYFDDISKYTEVSAIHLDYFGLEKIEHIIKKVPMGAYEYAYWVLNRRWKEAEPYIMKDPEYAYYYARDVIKGRWSEAEPYLMNTNKWVEYNNIVCGVCVPWW